MSYKKIIYKTHEDYVLFGDKSVISEIKSFCINFKIPDVTAHARGPKSLKWAIKQAMALDVWGSRILQPSDSWEKTNGMAV